MPFYLHNQETGGSGCGSVPKINLCSVWIYNPELGVPT